jgi:hypothetical protein
VLCKRESDGAEIDDRNGELPGGDPAQETVIGGDEDRLLTLREGEVHAVIHRMLARICSQRGRVAVYSLRSPAITRRSTSTNPLCRKTSRITPGGTHSSIVSQ